MSSCSNFSCITYPQSFISVPGERVHGTEDYDKITSKSAELVNSHIPCKSTNDFRFTSWNVHYWTGLNGKSNREEILQTLSRLQPSFVALQEVTCCLHPQPKLIFQMRNEIGLNASFFSSSVDPWQELGNAGFWRDVEPISAECIDLDYRRSALILTFHIRHFSFAVVNLHLEVRDESTREKQIQALIQKLDSIAIRNQIIMGDFNSRTESPVISAVKASGFVDVFDVLKWTKPTYTCWTGTVVDFIFVRGEDMKDRVRGAYAYYDTSSDHLPLVADIALE